MASSATHASPLFLRSDDRGSYAVWSGGNFLQANAEAIMKCVQDCRRGWNNRLFSNSLRSEGARGRRIFDQDRLHRRHVARGWDQVVVKIFALSGKKFFHERHSQSLGDAAFNLTFNQGGIDSAADIMSRRNLQNSNRTEFGVDFNLRHVRAKAVDRVGNALPIFIELAGGRVEGRFPGDYVTVLIKGHILECKQLWSLIRAHGDPVVVKLYAGRMRSAHQLQNRVAQLLSGHLRGLACYERLARCRSFSAVGGNRGISREQIKLPDASAQSVGTDLSHDRVRSLADIDGALMQCDAAVALETNANRRRIRQRRIAAAIPHSGDADAATKGTRSVPIEIDGVLPRGFPAWTQYFQAGANPDTRAESLSRHGRRVAIEGIQNAELQPIDASKIRQLVIELLLCYGDLRHPKSAKRPRRHEICMYRTGDGSIVRDVIRPGSMNRNAPRDRRSPGRIRAGIEISRTIQSNELALSRTTATHTNA